MSEWKWKNFSPSELSCQHCGVEGTKDSAKDTIQALRNSFGSVLVINSAYRCPEHNRNVGGVKDSRHVVGDGFDIRTSNMSKDGKESLYEKAKQVGFTGFGFYKTFIHVDKGPKRSWGDKDVWLGN